MNRGGGIKLKAKGRSKGALWQFVLILGLLALVWFSFGQNIILPQAQGGMPQRLEGLELVEYSEGQEAVTAVSRLHGTDISLETAYIATYSRDSERVTVWIGKVVSNEAAADLMKRMTDGIIAGTSGFTDLKRLSITRGYHEYEAYQVSGPGGLHYYYISRLSQDKIVWLTMQTENAGNLLETAIDTF